MDTRRALGRTILGGLGLAAALGLGGCDTAERLTTNKAIPVAPGGPSVAEARTDPIDTFARLVRPDDAALGQPIAGDQAQASVAALIELRGAFDRLDPVRKAQAVALTTTFMERIAIEPAPENWGEALAPSAEILTAALGEPSAAVRAGAIDSVGRFWSWKPGGAITPDHERIVGQWKERFYTPALSGLDDPEPGIRLAAVQCLGQLAIDPKAAPAVARLDDENPAVRLQVLSSFAGRRDLMTDEDVLPRLYDAEPAVGHSAQAVLRARGLDEEQIGLAKLLYHPRAELRISAIEVLQAREDIDPVVWLVQLSHDRDEAVRAEALKALARRPSPDACRRVAEMAEGDPSEMVRESANQLLPKMTAGLAPLPGTVIASPTAN